MKPVVEHLVILMIVILSTFLLSSGCTNRVQERDTADLFVPVSEDSQPVTTVPDQIPIDTPSMVRTPLAQATIPDQIPIDTPSMVRTPLAQATINNLSIPRVFYPTGYMGASWALSMMKFSKNNPHSAPDCIMIRYNALQDTLGWAGIYWQYPDNNWGTMKGYNVSGYSKLTFWARGEEGGEVCSFSVGGISGGTYKDTINPAKSTGSVRLSREWQKYTINLERENMSHIIGGFCYVVVKDQNPRGSTVYIDDIYFE